VRSLHQQYVLLSGKAFIDAIREIALLGKDETISSASLFRLMRRGARKVADREDRSDTEFYRQFDDLAMEAGCVVA